MAARTSSPSNGASASTARRRTLGLSVARGEDGREPAGVADRAERRGGRLADQRLGGACRQLDQSTENRVADLLTLAARPCGHLDHRDVVVGEEREQFDLGTRGGQFRRHAGGRSRPGRCVAVVRSGAVSRPSRSRAPSAASRTAGSGLVRPAVAVAGSDECPAMTTSRRLGPVIAGPSPLDVTA